MEFAPNRFVPNTPPCRRTRREFLWQVGGGFAGLALIDLLSRDGFFSTPASAEDSFNPLAPKKPHFAAKAKHVIFLFMNGAPSHVDTFDPKPALSKHDGKPYDRKDVAVVGSNNRPVGHLMQSPFEFKKYGQSGTEISSLFPHTAKWADDLCVIRSMHTDTAAHASGCLQMNTGSVILGRPALGSWVSYGLGTENENLPSFVVMNDVRGGPFSGPLNWTAGYMPAVYQGTMFRSGESPLLDLATPKGTTDLTQRRVLDLLGELNEKHRKDRPGDSELAARIQSYELAYRMQSSAAEAVNLDKEPEWIKTTYGLNHKPTAEFGRRCLITRRLLERGVRFIQLYSTVGRLDEMSEGLILLTNDGDLAQRLTHPRFGVEKTYSVQVAGIPSNEGLHRLTKGIWISEGRVRARRVKKIGRRGDSTLLQIVLSEGKNREIRRMLAKLGHKVMQLRRVAIGPIRLGRLKSGKSRRLSPPEVESLRRVASASTSSGDGSAPTRRRGGRS